MSEDHPRNVVVVGGPNGAGKTSWAVANLTSTLGIEEYVNADELARGLSPLNPEKAALAAGRLMLARLDSLVSSGRNFAFETTCAGQGHIRFLERCRSSGYSIMLIYLWLTSPQVALERVARRVAQAGHNVPEKDVVRRYRAGLHNMRYRYLPLADTALIFDNSDRAGILVAELRFKSALTIHDAERWRMIEETARWSM